MNRKIEIETRVDRSLRNQIKLPKLDRSFDAAVWARIEAAEARATNPGQTHAATSGSRWMFISNLIGGGVAIALVLVFGAQWLTGAGLDVAVPAISEGTIERMVAVLTWPITGLALLIGLSFTSYGRRLRNEYF